VLSDPAWKFSALWRGELWKSYDSEAWIGGHQILFQQTHVRMQFLEVVLKAFRPRPIVHLTVEGEGCGNHMTSQAESVSMAL
jgi:hypothetical protein